MANTFEFTSCHIFLLLFIYLANATRPEKDMLISFDDDDDEYDSDLMEEDFIKPLFEPSLNSEKSKIDPKLLIKAEYDWREAEKLLMKYAYPSKRWDEVNDDEIMPVDDGNDDIFVMEGKKHVCSILIRDRKSKNNKFDPITHSLFRSKNIDIPLWESNRYEMKKLSCLTFPYCIWKQLYVKVIRCICRIISGAGPSTTHASTAAKGIQIKREPMEDCAPTEDTNFNLELLTGSSDSSPYTKKESSEVASSPTSQPPYPFGIRKSCNPVMGSLLGLGRLNEQLLGNVPGLIEEPEPILENSVGLEGSHERGLGSLSELMEIPEPVLDKSIRPDRACKSANGSLRQTAGHETEMEEGADNPSKATELGESSEPGKTIRLEEDAMTPTGKNQLPPPTYALTPEDICLFGGMIHHYLYFSRGVSGENSFFVYGKADEPGMLRVIAHLILPEVENNNNEEQLK